jgi:hypothetical protein
MVGWWKEKGVNVFMGMEACATVALSLEEVNHMICRPLISHVICMETTYSTCLHGNLGNQKGKVAQDENFLSSAHTYTNTSKQSIRIASDWKEETDTIWKIN